MMRLFDIGRGGWIGVAAAVALLGAVAAVAAPSDAVIAERRAGYKHVGDIFKGMKGAIESGADVTPLAAGAGDIVAWAGRIPTLFPPGSDVGDTHALPAVWTERAEFERLAGKFAVEAGKLQTVAATGDKAAFLAQFKATGAVCGECHRTYRAKL